MTDSKAPTDTSLKDDIRTPFRIMPDSVRRVAIVAVLLGACLAALNLSVIFMIYPVFGYLTQSSGAGQQFQLPVVGISIDKSSAQLWQRLRCLS